ncbi:DUF2079 domain-containing protein [Leptothermofonsia sp. ETS-13]|uniref:DUF2079 domain-containing protein n=1 Tax=Leptothermofonsia sp. ETS-13 TaxID=3035696 RepID=UPI003BA3D1BF
MQQSSENIEPLVSTGSHQLTRQLPRVIGWMIGVSTLFLFVCSSLRHILFRSGALDLGMFDQAVYLISQGKAPISTLLDDIHMLGDHGAWMLYPLSLPYAVYPSVYWLLAIQAFALSLGALPTWALARQAGLNQAQSTAMVAVYLLYPIIFTANWFDFHPEVIALSAILTAIWAARSNKITWFIVAIIITLGCKEVMSLTVAAMGLWLLVFEKKRKFGAIALITGIAWFFFSTQILIPFFGGGEATGVERYSYLGNSSREIIINLFLKPWLILGRIFSFNTLKHLTLLAIPVIWGLSPFHLAPLIGALPTLLLNSLSDKGLQLSLFFHYSLPVLPFLLVAVISSLTAGHTWFRNQRAIVLWSVGVLLAGILTRLSPGQVKYDYVFDWNGWRSTREAIAQVQTKDGVLTTNEIAPHLSHRQMIRSLKDPSIGSADLNPFELAEVNYVLINQNNQSLRKVQDAISQLMEQLKNDQQFQLSYQQNKVYLFERKA